MGIKNRRQVVGAAANDLVEANGLQAFPLTGGAGGTFTPIENRGTTETSPFDINHRRQIVAGVLGICTVD